MAGQKRQRVKGKDCWAHHPRGGIVRGIASGRYWENGYYQRDIGSMSFPDSQVNLTAAFPIPPGYTLGADGLYHRSHTIMGID